MKFTKTLLNAPIVFLIICYLLFPVLSGHTVNHINVKTSTLIAYFSTKGKNFTVNRCFFTAITSHDNEKFHYHENDNIYHCDYHTFDYHTALVGIPSHFTIRPSNKAVAHSDSYSCQWPFSSQFNNVATYFSDTVKI